VHWALIIIYGAGGLAFSVWNMKGFFDAIPKELDEAAMIDGAGSFTIFGGSSYRWPLLASL